MLQRMLESAVIDVGHEVENVEKKEQSFYHESFCVKTSALANFSVLLGNFFVKSFIYTSLVSSLEYFCLVFSSGVI